MGSKAHVHDSKPPTATQSVPRSGHVERPMRGGGGLLQRKCACGGGSDETCESCQLARKPRSGSEGPARVPSVVGDALGSPGRPLDEGIQAEMGARFQFDFSRVRIHDDPRATESASAVAAAAYTVGRHVVFGSGYRPSTVAGRRLLAHELTHVVQQQSGNATVSQPFSIGPADGPAEREADAAADAVMSGVTVPHLDHAPASIQRTCGDALGIPSPACTLSIDPVVGWDFPFVVNCDDLRPGGDANLSKLRAGSVLDIHGFASIDGPAAFNLDLSCHRANKVADLLRTGRPDCTVRGVFMHGGVPAAGMLAGPSDPNFFRTVIVTENRVEPRPDESTASCGPDATDWLVQQIAAGKKNAKVLEIRNKLGAAALTAPAISKGFVAQEIMEGAIVEKIKNVRTSDPTLPPPTADANVQLAELSATFGFVELQTAKTEALGLGLTPQSLAAITTLSLLRDAALDWKALVGHGMDYDFKLHANTMGDPKSDHCPDTPPANNCASTITLCPGSPGSNCFGKDLPGNVFYAHVGGFAGFSENALQLGSQFAQLLPGGGKHWDPPEDTEMIDFGFNLAAPLTRSSFCADLQGAKSGFAQHKCKDCSESKMFDIVDPV